MIVDFMFTNEIHDFGFDLTIEILTALKMRTKPMSKDRYKIAASQPNSKAASQANGYREGSSRANGCRDRINIANHTRNYLIKLFRT